MTKYRAIATLQAAAALLLSSADMAAADSSLSREILHSGVTNAAFDVSRADYQPSFGLTLSVTEDRHGEVDVDGLVFSISSDRSGSLSVGDGFSLFVPECRTCKDEAEASRRRRIDSLD